VDGYWAKCCDGAGVGFLGLNSQSWRGGEIERFAVEGGRDIKNQGAGGVSNRKPEGVNKKKTKNKTDAKNAEREILSCSSGLDAVYRRKVSYGRYQRNTITHRTSFLFRETCLMISSHTRSKMEVPRAPKILHCDLESRVELQKALLSELEELGMLYHSRMSASKVCTRYVSQHLGILFKAKRSTPSRTSPRCRPTVEVSLTQALW
jgi:hypothetical protein